MKATPRWLLGLTCLLGLLPGMESSRAYGGSLDRVLLDRSGQIIDYLQQNKIRNIGVLPFEVQKGSRQPLFSGGPISTTLPRRIENALILTMDPDEKLVVGIIRDATTTANASGVGAYRQSESAFRKLFQPTYPLAWGDKTVKADAFLTGTVVSVGAERDQTELRIDLITPESWKQGKIVPQKSWKFTVRTDALLLADLGYNFALPRSVLKRGATASRRDEQARHQVERQEAQRIRGLPGDAAALVRPENIAGFAFELHYNGVKQLLQSERPGEGAGAVEYLAPPVPADARISMFLTRHDAEERTLGVVLMVNGQSTFLKEMADPLACRKWIYPSKARNRRDEWKGFYIGTEGKNLLPFKALTAEQSTARARELGNRAGWIDIYVFASKEKEDHAVKDEGEQELLITTRGMPSEATRPRTLKQLRAALLKANNLRERPSLVTKRTSGGLILHEMDPIEGGTFSTESLPDPVLIGHLAVKYFEPSDSME